MLEYTKKSYNRCNNCELMQAEIKSIYKEFDKYIINENFYINNIKK